MVNKLARCSLDCSKFGKYLKSVEIKWGNRSQLESMKSVKLHQRKVISISHLNRSLLAARFSRIRLQQYLLELFFFFEFWYILFLVFLFPSLTNRSVEIDRVGSKVLTNFSSCNSTTCQCCVCSNCFASSTQLACLRSVYHLASDIHVRCLITNIVSTFK